MTTPHDDHGLDHDSTEALTDVLADLRDEVRGLRGDVQAERRGRRVTQTLAAIVVTVALVGGAGWIADLRATVERRDAEAAAREVEACETRVDSRDDIRSGITRGSTAGAVAAVAAVASVVAAIDPAAAIDDDLLDAILTEVETAVAADVAQIALEALPPPDC